MSEKDPTKGKQFKLDWRCHLALCNCVFFSPGTSYGPSTAANRRSDAFNFSSRPPAKMQMPLELVLARPPSDTEIKRSNLGDTENQPAVKPDNIDGSDVLTRPTSRRQFRLDIKRRIRRLIGYLRSDSHSDTGCRDGQSTSIVDLQIQPHLGLSSPREGTNVYNLCKSARNYFETYSNEGDSMDTEERRRHIHECVETAAVLVCCAEVELGLFGNIGEALGEMGDKERTNDPLTIKSNPLFSLSWTCLSLVAIGKTMVGDRLQELAKFSMDGIARLQTGFGMVSLPTARRVDDHLEKAWRLVQALYLAFEPWTQNRTESEIKEILNSHEASISELERIEIETVCVEDVDWRISLLQDAMYETTHKLTRRLPGVLFNDMKPVAASHLL